MIDHLTVLCFVVWPLNKSEPGVVLVLIETSLPFFCKFVLISMRETSSWLQLLCFVIGLKVSRQFFSQLEAKPKPISPWTHDVFLALWATYKWCLGILFGSSRCSFLLWLIVVITLVLVFRQSFKNRSKLSIFCERFNFERNCFAVSVRKWNSSVWRKNQVISTRQQLLVFHVCKGFADT